jgi:tRNA threonylcarbamoyl adenosine modification protein YeaZ
MKGMNWLSIDSSSHSAAIALFNEESFLGGANTDVKVQHSENLLGAIDETLKASSLSVKDLSGIAVGIGPGSFTGLRIGISTARGICQALDLKILGIPSLINFAAQFETELTENGTFKTHTLITAKAFRGEFFYMEVPKEASFEEFLNGKFESSAITPEAWLENASDSFDAITVIGSGAEIFKSRVEEAPFKINYFAEDGKSAPIGLYISGKKFVEAEKFVDLYDLKPQYVRPSEAERVFPKIHMIFI